jgi:DNA-binding transcriptional LysR family regulator
LIEPLYPDFGTPVGLAYAERCRELASVAREANELVLGADEQPRGRLRITADPTFGEAYLPELIAEYLEQHAEVEVEAVLTSRHVDLIEEGFDLAFRVGRLDDSSLAAGDLSAGNAFDELINQFVGSTGVKDSSQH